MNKPAPSDHRPCIRGLVLAASLLFAQGAMAQFSMVPAPLCAPPKASVAGDEKSFRVDAARHIYACYPMRVYRGKLQPLLYGVMMVDTELDAAGNVLSVTVVRKPAADEVGPWVQAMIKRASPFPAPTGISGGTVTFTETFFVDKSGLFQTLSLTEGQN